MSNNILKQNFDSSVDFRNFTDRSYLDFNNRTQETDNMIKSVLLIILIHLDYQGY